MGSAAPGPLDVSERRASKKIWKFDCTVCTRLSDWKQQKAISLRGNTGVLNTRGCRIIWMSADNRRYAEIMRKGSWFFVMKCWNHKEVIEGGECDFRGFPALVPSDAFSTEWEAPEGEIDQYGCRTSWFWFCSWSVSAPLYGVIELLVIACCLFFTMFHTQIFLQLTRK